MIEGDHVTVHRSDIGVEMGGVWVACNSTQQFSIGGTDYGEVGRLKGVRGSLGQRFRGVFRGVDGAGMYALQAQAINLSRLCLETIRTRQG